MTTGAADTDHGAADAADQPATPGERHRERREIHGEDLLLSVRDLHVYFPIKSGIFIDREIGSVKAVDGVDLDVPRGSTVGLVGESGCGKTTFGRAVLRLVEPTGGTVHFDGVDVAGLAGEDLRRVRRRMQMIFQDPMASLDPRQSVESVLTEPRRAHGIERGRAKSVGELLDLVGLPASSASRYPHEFSGGQRQRIGIARAIALDPDLIIADEPVSALDVSIQAQVVNLLEELQDRLGLTYVVIAHDLAVVRHIADVVAVMYLGGIVEQASSDALYKAPYHPYTKALMSAVPIPDPIIEDTRQRILLTGDLPSPANPPTGCRFHTRCPYRQPTRCDDERPLLRVMSPEHTVACHWAEQIHAGDIQPRASAVVEAAVPDEPPRQGVPIPSDPDVTTLGPPAGV